MTARTDHSLRRKEIAEAVWRVLSTRGFTGLTLRRVAAEMGATTGLLTHYFADKRALLDHALTLVHERTDELLGARSGELRAALRSVLPLDPERSELAKVWIGFWDVALTDEEYNTHEALRYERWREKLRPLLMGRVADVEAAVDQLTAAAHGITIQALFAPQRFPAARQTEILDDLVDRVLAREPAIEQVRDNRV